MNSNQQNGVKQNQNPPVPQQPVQQIIPIDEVKQESLQSLQGNVPVIPNIQQKQVGEDHPQRQNQPNIPPPQQQPVIQDAQPPQFQQRIVSEDKSQIHVDKRKPSHIAEEKRIEQQPNDPPVETRKQHQINNQPPIPPVETRKENNFQQKPVQNNKIPINNPESSQIKLQQVNNLQKNPVLPPSNRMKKNLEHYNIKADIKQGMLAYDQEQRDLIHPIKTDQNSGGKVPGRDLKEERLKRSASQYDGKLSLDINCENDPLCNSKFSRDPVGDSLVDRDLTKFLQVGKRALLEVQSDVNNNTDQII